MLNCPSPFEHCQQQPRPALWTSNQCKYHDCDWFHLGPGWASVLSLQYITANNRSPVAYISGPGRMGRRPGVGEWVSPGSLFLSGSPKDYLCSRPNAAHGVQHSADPRDRQQQCDGVRLRKQPATQCPKNSPLCYRANVDQSCTQLNSGRRARSDADPSRCLASESGHRAAAVMASSSRGPVASIWRIP